MDTVRGGNMEYRKPVMFIYTANCNEELLEEVKAGIEEEGVPFEIKECSAEKDAGTLAYEAASSSILEAGIGIKRCRICFQCLIGKKLSPLLNIETEDKKALRVFGSNAARFVKGCSLRL